MFMTSELEPDGQLKSCMDNGIETLQLGTIRGDNLYNSKKFNDHVPLIGIIEKRSNFVKDVGR